MLAFERARWSTEHVESHESWNGQERGKGKGQGGGGSGSHARSSGLTSSSWEDPMGFFVRIVRSLPAGDILHSQKLQTLNLSSRA